MALGRFLKIFLSALFLVMALAIAKVGYSSGQSLPDIYSYATYQQAYQYIVDIAISTWATLIGGVRAMDHDDWLAISTVLIAIFTGVLAWSTVGLWRATGKTVQILADTERPHMLMSELKMRGLRSPPGPDGKVTLYLDHKFHNYGRSPAFLKSRGINYEIDKDLHDPPIYGDGDQTRFIVAVDSWYGSVEPSEIKLDGDDVCKFLMGEYEIFIFGFLTYTGSSKREHKTRFAYRMIFNNGDASERFYPEGPDSYWETS